MDEILRIEMPTREAFEADYLTKSRPVILTGGMAQWKAPSKWSAEYFRSSPVGSRVVPIERYPDGNRFGFPLWDHRPMRDMPLQEYMDLVSSDEATRYYLADQEVKTLMPELWGDIGIPPLFDTRDLAKTGLFLGRDTIDAAHCHPDMQVLLCQAVGKKRVVLFAPEDGKLLSPAPWYCPNFNWSTVNFDNVEAAKQPDLRRARRIEVTLSPGEMLFIPVQWWNLMYGEGFNASICFIWRAALRDWPFPMPGLRVVGAGLFNLGIVRPLLPLIQRVTGGAAAH